MRKIAHIIETCNVYQSSVQLALYRPETELLEAPISALLSVMRALLVKCVIYFNHDAELLNGDVLIL